MNNKKILFLDHDSNMSGSTVSLVYLLNRFIDNDWTVYLLTRKNKQVTDSFISDKVKIYHNKGTLLNIVMTTHICEDYSFLSKAWIVNNIKNILRFFVGIFISFGLMIKIKPDIVYINEHVLAQCSISSSVLKIPSVIHLRSLFIKGKFGWRNKFWAKLILLFNKKIFAITRQEAAQISLKNSKVIVVPEFLSKKDYLNNACDNSNLVRMKLHLPIDKKIILFLGGINRIKGTFELVSIIKNILQKLNNVVFVIAGSHTKDNVEDIAYYNKVMKIINDDKLSNNLILLEYISNARDYILAADVLVSYPTISHFARPVIEAWALKKAVVSSNVKHSLDYLIDRENALIFQVDNPKSLENAVIEILSNSDLYSKISNNGYIKAKKEYDELKNINEIIDICNKLI